jgi:hypothetical protein
VGDAKEVIDGVENSYICSYEAEDVIQKLQKAIAIGHLRETHLDPKYIHKNIVNQIFEIYQKVCKNL